MILQMIHLRIIISMHIHRLLNTSTSFQRRDVSLSSPFSKQCHSTTFVQESKAKQIKIRINDLLMRADRKYSQKMGDPVRQLSISSKINDMRKPLYLRKLLEKSYEYNRELSVEVMAPKQIPLKPMKAKFNSPQSPDHIDRYFDFNGDNNGDKHKEQFRLIETSKFRFTPQIGHFKQRETEKSTLFVNNFYRKRHRRGQPFFPIKYPQVKPSPPRPGKSPKMENYWLEPWEQGKEVDDFTFAS